MAKIRNFMSCFFAQASIFRRCSTWTWAPSKVDAERPEPSFPIPSFAALKVGSSRSVTCPPPNASSWLHLLTCQRLRYKDFKYFIVYRSLHYEASHTQPPTQGIKMSFDVLFFLKLIHKNFDSISGEKKANSEWNESNCNNIFYRDALHQTRKPWNSLLSSFFGEKKDDANDLVSSACPWTLQIAIWEDDKSSSFNSKRLSEWWCVINEWSVCVCV